MNENKKTKELVKTVAYSIENTGESLAGIKTYFFVQYHMVDGKVDRVVKSEHLVKPDAMNAFRVEVGASLFDQI